MDRHPENGLSVRSSHARSSFRAIAAGAPRGSREISDRPDAYHVRHTAVDIQNVAGNVTCGIRSQKNRRTANLFRTAEAIESNCVHECLHEKYKIPEMIKAGGGAIVNSSSIAGMIAFPGLPAYVASKHGVIGLTKNAALEFANQNVRVNAVCPGVIHTPMIDRLTHGEEQAERAMAEGAPMGRMGTVEEIARTALWLCSDESSFVTGHALVADGGWVAR